MKEFIWLGSKKPSLDFVVGDSYVKIYGALHNPIDCNLSSFNLDEFKVRPESIITGDYSFVIQTEAEIYIGTSRSGVQPLYFRILDRQLVASDLLHDVIISSNKNRLSIDGASQFLNFEYVCDPITLIEGVYKVPPDSSLVYSVFSGELSLNQCSNLGDIDEDQRSLTQFRDQVYKAHESRIAPADNALLLSGGIDSCASAVVLKDLLGKDHLATFTFSIDGAEQDEFGDAEITAKHLGLEQHRITVDPNAEVDFESLVAGVNFFYPGSIILKDIASKAAKNTNFFACQDTRLHTPSLNLLDKNLIFLSQYSRSILSGFGHCAPRIFNKNTRVDKVIARVRDIHDLPSYLDKYFYHKHDVEFLEKKRDTRFNTDLLAELERNLDKHNLSSRQIYNTIIQAAWPRQYTDDIQYLKSSMELFGSKMQLPWYDRDLALLSASIPMREATKFVKGRAGHSDKPKRVNKYVLRQAFEGSLPDKIMFRDKAVCMTNHLFLNGSYREEIEKLSTEGQLFDTECSKVLGLHQLFLKHKDRYRAYGVQDYENCVELQNLVALNVMCRVYSL